MGKPFGRAHRLVKAIKFCLQGRRFETNLTCQFPYQSTDMLMAQVQIEVNRHDILETRL